MKINSWVGFSIRHSGGILNNCAKRVAIKIKEFEFLM
jgi:hypothetical protein